MCPTNPPNYMKKYWAKNWRANYKKYSWTPQAIKERAARNAARRKLHLKKGDPREAHHVDWNLKNNWQTNIRAISRRLNRKLGWASSKRTNGVLGK